MKRTMVGLSLAAAVALAASSVQAATVTVIDTTQAWANVDETQSITLPAGSVWSAAPTIRQGNLLAPTPIARSPFDDSGANAPGAPGFEEIDYFATSVGPGGGNPTNPSVLDFSVDQTSLTFLWGSVDTYNLLEFLNNGGVVATITSALLIAADGTVQLGVGSAYVSITDLIFDQIRISSSQNAFEYSNLVTTPIPLPPALLLFGGALAGLGYLARRRRQTTGPGLAA
jgi:hypothetical protein